MTLTGFASTVVTYWEMPRGDKGSLLYALVASNRLRAVGVGGAV